MKVSIKFLVLLCLTILWIMFIFSFSMQTGEESSQLSGGIVSAISPGDFQYAVLLEILIRKGAHFAEYFVLGVLVSLTDRETRCSKLVLIPWALGTLVACCDETIQLFSNGRSGQVTDVMLDSVGVLCGCVVVYLVWKRLGRG